MIPSNAPARGIQALADTVVAVQARGTLDIAADIAVIALAASLAATCIALIVFLRRLKALERTVTGGVRRTLDRAGPLVERSGDVADNIEFITRALRTDVERLNASVKALTDRLHLASDHMEDRVEEFNALMEVVQSEAEAIFIDTASTVRGVRAGARTLGDAGDAPVPPIATPGGADVQPTHEPDAPEAGGNLEPVERGAEEV